MRSIRWALLLGGIVALGCGQQPRQAESALKQAGLKGEAGPDALREKDAGAPAKAGEQAPEEVKRLIIYTGNVEVIVDDFDQAREQLDALVEEYGGDFADWETRGTPGTPRSGTWTVRVPAARFRTFMDAAQKLGELRLSKVDSEDITDRYYDLEVRIETDERERQALLKLLEKAADEKLTDVLAVRDKLNEVEARLDQQKGQRKRWKQLVDLATIHITLRDRKDYVPPIVPDFGTRIGRTFQGSVEALLAFFRGVVLVVVALAPWLAVLAVPGLPLLIWWRIRRRRRAPLVAQAVAEERPSASSDEEGSREGITEGEGE
jgi:hypothetical protein